MKLRVVFVLKSFHFGGAERYALHLIRHFAASERFETHVVAFGDPEGRLSGILEADGVPTSLVRVRLHRPLRKLGPALGRLARHLRSLQPDVLLPYLNTPNVTCGVLWRLVGAKTCIWNQQNLGSDATGRWIESLAVRATPFFVANAHAGADFLVTRGAPNRRVRVISNGVQLPPPVHSPASWRERLAVDDRCLLVASLAHFAPRKDHDTLIRAWARLQSPLRASGIEARLLLAGREGATLQPALQLTKDLGVATEVEFLGEIDDVGGLLRAAHVGVLSSHHEGCPNAVQEYMAAGLPVVATDLPGVRDAFSEVSMLSPPRDPDRLAELLLPLLLDPTLRERVGEQNRSHVQSRFGVETMCAAWTSLIHQATGHPSDPTATTERGS